MSVNLDFLPAAAFLFMLFFARIGAMMMALPGIGDKNVPQTIRLALALSFTAVLYPMLSETAGVPAVRGLHDLVASLVREAVTGLALGFAVRMVMTAVQIAGAIISFQTGLAFANSVDPSTGGQDAAIGNFLTMLAVALIFVADIHHMLFQAIRDSYILFPAAWSWPVGDFTELATNLVGGGFRIAVQISAPFILFGLVFHIGIGVLARLIPQIQIFFIAMPANIAVGLVLIMLLISGLMMAFLQYFDRTLTPFLAGG